MALAALLLARLRHEGGGVSGECLAAGVLPHAAGAISALFGGLLTKVGVYALLRVLVMLLPASGWCFRA